MSRAGLLLLLAGCFSRPPAPPADSTGPGGDDGPVSVGCAKYGDWGTQPTAVGLAMPSGTWATDPWMSDDTNELYFAYVVKGPPAQYSIWHATRTTGTSWVMAKVELGAGLPNSDNPFVTADGTLWFDDANLNQPYIYAAPSDLRGGGFLTPVQHTELTTAQQPTLTPASDILYYRYGSSAQIERTTMTTGGVFVVPSVVIAPDIDWPAISSDNGTLYYNDYTTGERIYQATFSPSDHSTLINQQLVGSFQTDANGGYSSPSISRDGKTLVFAYRASGATDKAIFYVQRPCL